MSFPQEQKRENKKFLQVSTALYKRDLFGLGLRDGGVMNFRSMGGAKIGATPSKKTLRGCRNAGGTPFLSNIRKSLQNRN